MNAELRFKRDAACFPLADRLPRKAERLGGLARVPVFLDQVGIRHSLIVRSYGRKSRVADELGNLRAAVSTSLDVRPFKERLREAAQIAKVEYRPTAIANSLGISKQTVHQWMDKGRPTPENIFLIADKWALSPRWVALEEGPVKSEKPAVAQIESPEITRLILAFGWLTKKQKKTRLAELEADALTNKTFAKELGAVDFEFKSDQEMLDHLLRGGDFPPGKKKAQKTKRPKRQGFAEEDPE